MFKLFRLMSLVVLISCSVDAADLSAIKRDVPVTGLQGSYVIVDIRKASLVAAPSIPDLVVQAPVGQIVDFSKTVLALPDKKCPDWQLVKRDSLMLEVDTDPNLIDLKLAPADGPASSNDQRENIAFDVVCNGEVVTSIHKVDDRVLVMPWANSAMHLILEKPLTMEQIRVYQRKLKSMKFFEGEPTGELDEETLRASRSWYVVQAQLNDNQPVLKRPAITENLLDTLEVIP